MLGRLERPCPRNERPALSSATPEVDPADRDDGGNYFGQGADDALRMVLMFLGITVGVILLSWAALFSADRKPADEQPRSPPSGEGAARVADRGR